MEEGLGDGQGGTPGRKEGGRCTGGEKKRGKKKLRKVAGTEIKGCG